MEPPFDYRAKSQARCGMQYTPVSTECLEDRVMVVPDRIEISSG
jgi:hypothetical protein